MNYYNYSYGTGLDSSSSMETMILAVYSVFILVWAVISLASYVLRGIGFYTIAKEHGDENAWMAFVPFARKYQQGELAGNITLNKKRIQKTGIWFLVLPIAWGIVSYLIGMIFGVSMIGKVVRYVMSSYGNYNFDVEDIMGILVAFLIVYVLAALIYKAIYTVLLTLIDVAILNRYTEGNMPLVHGVLCALFPLYESICVFVISRRIAPKRNAENAGQQNNPYSGNYQTAENQNQQYAGSYQTAENQNQQYEEKYQNFGEQSGYQQVNPEPPVQEAPVQEETDVKTAYGEYVPKRGLLQNETAEAENAEEIPKTEE